MLDPSIHAPLLKSGHTIGVYRIVRFLGRGGMSEVYIAEQPTLQRKVAIKILPPNRSDPKLIERFLREARLCSRIEHPNVVTIHDVGECNGLNFIVMQYVEGMNLAELLALHPNGLPWATAVRLIHLTGKGLNAVHEHNLLHRDIKPSNIMLAKDGRLLLMDFGLVCQESGSDLTETGIVVGTIPFMSPEQSRGESTDRRSDIFSLGSTLYTLLSNKRPYTGNSTEIFAQLVIGRKPPPVHEVNPSVPLEVSAIVSKAMETNPNDRFPTMRQMNKALAEVVRSASRNNSTSQDLIVVRAGRNESLKLPLLEPIDAKTPAPVSVIVPLEATATWIEPVDSKRAWMIGGIVTTGLLLLAVTVNLLVGGDDDAAVPDMLNPAVSPSITAVTSGMVAIPAGRVILGNDAGEIRSRLEDRVNAQSLQNLIENVAEPGLQAKEVAAFWIDPYEVTNAEYQRFLEAAHYPPPSHWSGLQPPVGHEQLPVTNISYEDAEAYAHWRGKELPTAEQWVRAARSDGRTLFPWGDDFSVDRANVSENRLHKYLSVPTATPDDVSPFRVYNLAGNASEFLRGYTVRQGAKVRMTKGAAYKETGAIYGVASATFYYDFPSARNEGLGFRCVVSQP